MNVFNDNVGKVEVIDVLGDDMRIVQAARVSYNRETKGEEADEKLLKYLLREGHLGPFEHVVITMKVTAPIFVVRQWFRHRTWSYNEISRRYTSEDIKFYIPEIIRAQSIKNKQGSDRFEDPVVSLVLKEKIRDNSARALDLYNEFIEANIAREVARLVLPVNLYTSFYATVDLRNLFGFLEQRLDEHAQFEIREYAKAILDLVTPYVPWAINAWKEQQNV